MRDKALSESVRPRGSVSLVGEASTLVAGFPRFGMFLSYPLTKAVMFLAAIGQRLHAHVLIVGPVGFAVLWRTREKETSPSDRTPSDGSNAFDKDSSRDAEAGAP